MPGEPVCRRERRAGESVVDSGYMEAGGRGTGQPARDGVLWMGPQGNACHWAELLEITERDRHACMSDSDGFLFLQQYNRHVTLATQLQLVNSNTGLVMASENIECAEWICLALRSGKYVQWFNPGILISDRLVLCRLDKTHKTVSTAPSHINIKHIWWSARPRQGQESERLINQQRANTPTTGGGRRPSLLSCWSGATWQNADVKILLSKR